MFLSHSETSSDTHSPDQTLLKQQQRKNGSSAGEKSRSTTPRGTKERTIGKTAGAIVSRNRGERLLFHYTWLRCSGAENIKEKQRFTWNRHKSLPARLCSCGGDGRPSRPGVGDGNTSVTQPNWQTPTLIPSADAGNTRSRSISTSVSVLRSDSLKAIQSHSSAV